MSEHPKSFFQSFTGVITAIASLIVAITGLYAATDGFNFGSNTQQTEIVEPNNEQDHLTQLQNLKRQKEIDDLRIQQEKRNLLAQQEIAALKAQLHQTAQIESVDVSYQQTNSQYATPNISGNWTLTNQIGTYVFVIEQNGNQLSVQEYDSFNNNVGSGNGVINGTDVELNWTEPYLFVMTIDLEADLTLNASGTLLSGTMYSEESQVPIRLYRQ
ncbi:hypothetical protein L0668_07735 [Paraglaciecola aquimarina]|uniref:Uncharacterized protein n=1 Tax=Paraglaciecola algarum TaxID=3050085 RepID=A0ABS9D7J6_9ALTE|nr:hypothetical protein [Paraglaciecola sp. G1-23]MCF2947993.1 hypothetical protein [Paraglaciecola sp. G1-23]